MNRELIVKLLHKDIRELEMITSGFMEMNVYPNAIILLAQQKTADIQLYLEQLSNDVNDESGKFESKMNFNGISTKKKEEEIEIIEEEEEEDLEEEVEEEDDELTEETLEVTKEEVEEVTEKHFFQFSTKNSENAKDYNLDKQIDLIETPQSQTIVYTEETKKTILAEKNIVQSHSRNELLSQADKTVSSALANKKVTDIKQAISIGDRFRFQRELFKGNGEDMNKTFTYINLLATQDEALSFLKSKYGWSTENETAEDFLQIVRRRFL